MHHARIALALATTALAFAAGCSKNAAPAASPTLTSAIVVGRALPVLDGKRELLLGARLVQHCQEMHDAPDNAPPTMLLGALARCVIDGDLKAQQLVVVGGLRERTYVRRVLADLGVDAERVDTQGPLDDDDCIDECEVSPRVTIEVTSL